MDILPDFYKSARPYARWWWFSNSIEEDDIKYQLDWLKQNGFGGVEIAWVYPQPGQPRGPKWLGREWSDLVAFTKSYCDRIGLGCDFTFGTLWPFGGTMVGPEDALKTFDGVSPVRLDRTWEEPERGLILDHLDRCSLDRYSEIVGSALGPALAGSPSALFCDSWEVPAEKLWTDGFGSRFEETFGYDVKPYMDGLDGDPDVRYDYRKLLADYVLNEFYRPFTAISRRHKSFTRVQCHGAPTDVLSAYAAADVPESEAILFDPDYSRIPASAAALAGKRIVSAEAFTCLYGWTPYPGPGPGQKREQLGDLKLLADSLLANGVNLFFWHGMPYNPAGGKNMFYATVHLGPDSPFAAELPGFNRYLRGACEVMQRGVNCSDLAVYLPLEDMWMKNELPDALKKPSARYYWELHTAKPAEALRPYHPLWVTGPFLKESAFEDGVWHCGKTEFRVLYVDCEWLDQDCLTAILRLGRQGLPVVLKQRPRQPGKTRSPAYDRDLDDLSGLKNVFSDLAQAGILTPIAAGEDLPDFWSRQDAEDRYFFFSHPGARGLTYPMTPGQHLACGRETRLVRIHAAGRDHEIELRFEPGESKIVKCRGRKCELMDIGT